MAADCYITLMSSLPHLGSLFSTRQSPISRIRLERRLQQLEPKDATTLHYIEDVLLWTNQPIDRSDTEIIDCAKKLMAYLNSEFLQELVRCQLEERTLIAALRYRQRGERAPDTNITWGFGRWNERIRQFWGEPSFRLESVFPWVLEANRLLAAGDSIELERLLMRETWHVLGRMGEGHYFDFEAVVIYVLRWDIIDRWATYSNEPAVQNFKQLVQDSWNEQALIF